MKQFLILLTLLMSVGLYAEQRVPLWKIRIVSDYPNASNTGVPAGTSLTAYAGPTTITVDGTTIDSKTISNCLSIRAINVTISKSRLIANGCAINSDAELMWGETSGGAIYAVTIVDSELSCNDAGGTALLEAYIDVLRTEITGCENGASISQKIRIRDSYIHALSSFSGDPHEDGIQMSDHYDGADYVDGAINFHIEHNTIYGRNGSGDTGNGTSAIIMSKDGVSDEDGLIHNNVLGGGAFVLYCNRWDDDHAEYSSINVPITNNRWTQQWGGSSWTFGHSTDCADEDISGNVFHESGLPITLNTEPLPLFHLFLSRLLAFPMRVRKVA